MRVSVKFILPLLLLCSCAKDRTYEYEEKTRGNHWMETAMQEWYLWGDSLQPLDWRQYFAAPATFVSRLIAQSKANDNWSFCSIDTVQTDNYPIGKVNRTNTYGIDYVLMNDPTGETTRQYARVVTVFPGSPAMRCGLQRGDFIAQVGDEKITRNVADRLLKGLERKLVVNRLGMDNSEGEIFWATVDTLNMETSEAISIPAVMSCNMLTDDVAYIMLTSLADYSSIESSLAQLLANSPADLIVDLRLCNYGTLDCVLSVANQIATTSGPFLRTVWNENKSNNNTTFNINASTGLHLFFITSNYTCGAAEWLIYGLQTLQPSDVRVVGQTTAGQYVMLQAVPSDYYFTIYPAVAYVCNAEGDCNYKSGIAPDDEIDEVSYMWLFPYGDPREVVIDFILENN